MWRALSLLLLALPGVGGCHSAGAASGGSLVFAAPAGDPAQAVATLTGPAATALARRFGTTASATDVEALFSLSLRPRDGAPPAAPLLADLAFQGDRALLRPRAPLTRGLVYEARFDGRSLSPSQPVLTARYAPPPHAEPSPTRVTDLYPGFPELPANSFRFYLWFSEPMAQGRVFEHVRLVNERGEPLPMAFHEVELWDPEHRRLTLWISPGRTKSALGITETAGHVLEPGRRYTLEVLPGLPDRQGRPLAAAFRHAFRTRARDDVQPRLAAWKLAPPAAGTREPLRVTFDEPLDRPLLATALAVADPRGAPLLGEGRAAADGRSWAFTPAAPWAAGRHWLLVQGDLDDLAGNSLHRRFEAPAGEGARPAVQPPVFERSFSPRPPGAGAG